MPPLVPSSWRHKGQLEGTQGLESAGDAKGQQSLESAATLTLGSFSHGALEDTGGMEVQQCFWLVVQQIYSEKWI